jgi:hypothetical protein
MLPFLKISEMNEREYGAAAADNTVEPQTA